MQFTVLPAGARGFDTASRLTAAILDAAKAAGITFVVKYVPYGPLATSKMWTADEVALCHSRGLAVLAVWEVQGNRALGGAPVGAVDGGQARGGMTRLGYPADLFISTAVDYDVWAPNSAATLAYVRAFARTCGGGEAAYGDEDVADGLIGDNPTITLPNAPAWSRILRAAGTSQAARVAAARGIPDVHIYQFPSGPMFGIGVDPLLVLQPTRAWLITPDPAPAATPAPSPVPASAPAPTPQEDHMATAKISVEGRNAVFYATGTLLADGNVHVLEAVWSGPGDPGAADNAFMRAHDKLPDVVPQHYALDTMHGIILVGCAAEQIEDALAPGGYWAASEFRTV